MKLDKGAFRKLVNRVRYGSSADGPYRFLVRNWSGLDDIDLVSAVLGTETFRRMLVSKPVPLQEMGSLFVIAPHQDDEMIGAGGLCIQARKRQVPCSIMFLTDGAETGLGRQHGKLVPPDEVVKIRAAEAKAVCGRLNAEYLELGVSNIGLAPTIEQLDAFAALLQQRKPQVVVMPWLLDGAPKHRVANHMLWLASKRHKLPPFEVWGYQVNNSPLANGVLDITSEIEEKVDILKLYVSQNELIRRYDYQAWGLAAWNARFLSSKGQTSEARYAELFCMLPRDEHLRLVEQYYFRDLARTYMGHGKLIAGMQALHTEVLNGV